MIAHVRYTVAYHQPYLFSLPSQPFVDSMTQGRQDLPGSPRTDIELAPQLDTYADGRRSER